MRIPLLALAGTLALASTASALEFRFAPPDGHECDQKMKNTVTTVIRSGNETVANRLDSSDSVTHVRIAKADGGYRITSKATSGEMSRDGKPVTDSITKLLVGQELTMDVGPDGKATEVKGYEPLVKSILDKLEPGARERLSAVFNAQALRDKDIADWNGKVAAYVGKELKEGDVWERKDSIPMSAAPLEYTALTKVAKIETKDGRTLVTLEFAYERDGDAARQLLDKGTALSRPAGELGKPEIHGTATRVVDAATMDFLRETETRVITAPIQVPGKGPSTVERTEKREYTLECSK